LIDRLIASKLVSRQVGEDDRRSVRVEITERGKKIVSNIWEQKRRSLEKVFTKVSAGDRRQYLEILEKVVKVISTQMCAWVAGLLLSFNLLSGIAYAEDPLTLKQCYQLALNRSETIAINQQVIKEAEGQFWQSLSGVLPQVNYVASSQWQDRGSGDNPRSIRSRRFTFSQPLFSGFKEYAAIAGAKAQHKERESQLKRAKELLFIDVSDAFYYFESYQEDLQVLDDIHKAFEDRLAELKRRQSLGRSRESEVASAQASLYKTEADQEGVRSQLEVARQLLEFLVGKPVTNIKDEDLPNDSVKSMEELTALVIQRPDVEAAREALIVAQKAVTVARAGFFPTVSLNGDTYDKRQGSSADVDWDITLNVNVPVFNGTTTIGALKQAKAQERESELSLSQTKRAAVLDIQNAYTKFTLDQKRELALRKASDAANRNYRLQQDDYNHSLVNNLEVLQALQDWESSFRDYIIVKNETKRFYWNLKIATGDVGHDAF
ncbi:MAG: TolC family protein, partial [Candidatus Omnitrophota bacterium]